MLNNRINSASVNGAPLYDQWSAPVVITLPRPIIGKGLLLSATPTYGWLLGSAPTYGWSLGSAPAYGWNGGAPPVYGLDLQDITPTGIDGGEV